MLHPASERESFRLLAYDSAFCELIEPPLSQLKPGALVGQPMWSGATGMLLSGH